MRWQTTVSTSNVWKSRRHPKDFWRWRPSIETLQRFRAYCSWSPASSEASLELPRAVSSDASALLGDLKHALQRDSGPLRSFGIDDDLVDDVAVDEVLEHPRQVRCIDAEHRGARTDERIEGEDRLVGVFAREPLHHVHLGADRERRTGRRFPRPLLNSFG